MGVYARADSPFWWLLLERPDQRPLRESSLIPLDAGSPAQIKENRRQAQALYAARMVALARRRNDLPVDRPSRTFAEHRAWYLAHVSPHKRGAEREASMLKQLGRYLDAVPLASLDQVRIREWRTKRVAEVKPSSAHREEALLRHLLTTAVPTYLETNPLADLPQLRITLPDVRTLTVDEERRLLRALHTNEDRALVICALDTLLRLSNVARLMRAQDHGRYLFADTKTGTVQIPISTRLRRALDALPKTAAAYFPTYAAKSRDATAYMFRHACARGRVTTGRANGGVSFHCLRHTGASRMLAAGVDVKTVMRIGGWKSLAVLERYLHPTDTASRTAVNAVGRHAALTRRSKRRRTLSKSAK